MVTSKWIFVNSRNPFKNKALRLFQHPPCEEGSGALVCAESLKKIHWGKDGVDRGGVEAH